MIFKYILSIANLILRGLAQGQFDAKGRPTEKH